MPIYEYRCDICEQQFEEMVRLGDGAGEIRCPRCGAQKVNRLLSLFGVGQATAASASNAAGDDGGRMCGCGGCTCGHG